MRSRVTTLIRREPPQTPMAPALDPQRVTMRLDHDKLFAWPGNVQRWIERDKQGELVVRHFPCIGQVKGRGFENGDRDAVMEYLPATMQSWLCCGMAIVVGRECLPEPVRRLV